MTDIVSIRKEAVESATKAVDLDDKEKFEEAVKYYIKAAEKLNYLSKIDENQYNQYTLNDMNVYYMIKNRKIYGCIKMENFYYLICL